jgi:queuine tRNA-ribosyltransferase
MFTIINKQNQARTGILEINGRKAETPFFMPVATKAVGRFVTSEEYNQCHANAIISNAFFLSSYPGLETFENAKGIHNFMNYQGIIFNDCGGFQMLRENILKETTNNGILLKNPFGKDVFMRPEKLMQIASVIKPDVIMALDCVLPFGKTKEEYEIALEKSHRWSKESLKFRNSETKVFGITQGGTFPDLREESAKAINSMNFDGYALGGLGIGEPSEKMYEMIEISIPNLEDSKPRYLMGVGKPDQIIECVSRGIDIFDSIYPQKNARHGMLFTFNGIIDLGRGIYRHDFTPIDKDCKCTACKLYTKAYLRYLLKKDDAVGKRYLTIHNIYFMQEFMKKIRESINENRFEEFKKEFLQKFKKAV